MDSVGSVVSVVTGGNRHVFNTCTPSELIARGEFDGLTFKQFVATTGKFASVFDTPEMYDLMKLYNNMLDVIGDRLTITVV